jgi:hypothetical protein
MGIINQGILGGVSGTVGNVVGGSWKGIDYLRGKAESYNDAHTEGQVNQRTKFAACVAFSQSIMDTLIKPIWDRKAVKMSGFNLFMKTNIDVFDDTGQLIGLENLKLSVGSLPLPTGIVVQNDGVVAGAIRVTWEDNSGIGIAASTDRLRIAAISNGVTVVMKGLAFTRSEGMANVQLPFGAGATVHVYVFFQNDGNTKYSTDFHHMLQIPIA